MCFLQDLVWEIFGIMKSNLTHHWLYGKSLGCTWTNVLNLPVPLSSLPGVLVCYSESYINTNSDTLQELPFKTKSFKTQFSKIGVKFWPKLTRYQKSISVAINNGILFLLPWCVASNKVLIAILRLKLYKVILHKY